MADNTPAPYQDIYAEIKEALLLKKIPPSENGGITRWNNNGIGQKDEREFA